MYEGFWFIGFLIFFALPLSVHHTLSVTYSTSPFSFTVLCPNPRLGHVTKGTDHHIVCVVFVGEDRKNYCQANKTELLRHSGTLRNRGQIHLPFQMNTNSIVLSVNQARAQAAQLEHHACLFPRTPSMWGTRMVLNRGPNIDI